jgi:hypothetical protein
MQVELPVEPDWLDEQGVAVCVRAFERNNAALIAPERGNDDGEFEVGLLGEFFQFRLVLPDDACFADHYDAHGTIIK